MPAAQATYERRDELPDDGGSNGGNEGSHEASVEEVLETVRDAEDVLSGADLDVEGADTCDEEHG